MARIVQHVRAVEQLVGRPEKEVQPAEGAVVIAARRSIAAAADLASGHRLEARDLTWLRPRGGLRPGDEAQLLGKALKRAIPFGQMIRPEDVE
jgi:N-acetylneuraminate synthase/N,N'-diacetyllegionaminate synthase